MHTAQIDGWVQPVLNFQELTSDPRLQGTLHERSRVGGVTTAVPYLEKWLQLMLFPNQGEMEFHADI